MEYWSAGVMGDTIMVSGVRVQVSGKAWYRY
jgi:hypothetical protein